MKQVKERSHNPLEQTSWSHYGNPFQNKDEYHRLIFPVLLCVFISGHKAVIKPSSKDETLVRHLTGKLCEWNRDVNELIVLEEMLKGCDAYIATGSNNSARYFEYYFNKYPHIIRRNRTSVAVLDGNETREDHENLPGGYCLPLRSQFSLARPAELNKELPIQLISACPGNNERYSQTPGQ